PELIFPTEHALDGIEPFFENGGVEERLAASFGCFSTARIRVDIGNHSTIENGFPVRSAIVDAIQADNGSLEVKANRVGDPRHQWQGFAQQRRFIAIARRRNKRRNHIAIAIAEGDDLVAFHLLVTAETNVVAAFLRRGRCTVAESLYYTWSKEFLEAGKRRLAGDTERAVRLASVARRDLEEQSGIPRWPLMSK